MTIKEVVGLTGLSDKTIRYYESEGLISVKRKSNGYREYSKENIRDLNTIVLLRYLSLSINEIKSVFENSENWDEIQLDLKNKINNSKIEIEYQESIMEVLSSMSFFDISSNSKDLLSLVDKELLLSFESIKYPSLFDTIIQTLILLGPVLWLIAGVYWGAVVNFKVALPLSLLSVIFITLGWRKYLKGKAHKSKGASTFASLVLVLLVLVIGIASTVAVSIIQESIFTNDSTVLFVSNYPLLLYILLVSVILLFGSIIFGIRGRYIEDIKFEYLVEFYDFIKRHVKGISIILSIFIYAVISSVTVVNNDGSIIRYGMFNQKGTSYSVNEIQEVQVGYNRGFLKEYKNDFYMRLKTNDFKVDIVQSNVIEESDTYDALVGLDLLYKDVHKVVGSSDSKYCSYDKKYCEKFESIMGVVD